MSERKFYTVLVERNILGEPVWCRMVSLNEEDGMHHTFNIDFTITKTPFDKAMNDAISFCNKVYPGKPVWVKRID